MFAGHYWETVSFGQETNADYELDFNGQVLDFIRNGHTYEGQARKWTVLREVIRQTDRTVTLQGRIAWQSMRLISRGETSSPTLFPQTQAIPMLPVHLNILTKLDRWQPLLPRPSTFLYRLS